MAFREVTNLRRTPAPAWLRDLVIYEVNPRTFTSPNGAGDGNGSGTFKSMMEKLPYIRDLGASGIWLAGHTESTNHFSNIWTVYAMRDPRRVDPDLGTAEDLKELVRQAHAHGLYVFAEVVTHGVTSDSPLLTEHPDWFRGGEWGMVDFNYENAEFTAWWVDLWTLHALEFDFDGYRLDGPNGVSGFEQVMRVWDRIAEACLNRGKQIAVMGENCRYHFRQNDIMQFTHDAAGDFAPYPQYQTMQISSHDEGIMMGEGNYYALRGSRFKFGYSAVFGCNIPLFMAGEEFDAGQHSLPILRKAMYPGYEQSREIEFYDANPESVMGGWLYGSRIDWSELARSPHSAMLEDCSRILRIRRENRDLLHYDRAEIHILPVRCQPKSGSIPFLRYLPGKKAILIVGNETPVNHDFILQVPLVESGLDWAEKFNVTDLWTGAGRIVEAGLMCCLQVSVPGDYQPGGGVRAVLIEPL